MTSKGFLFTTITALVCGIALIAGTSYHANAYGLFGNVAHTSYTAYRGERTTKYLFAYNYIPANFDALLLGASISLNWNTKRVTGERIYNASISGANMFEEGLIAEQVMNHRRLTRLVIVLHPYLTMTHLRRTEYMTPDEYWSAWGSVSLFFLEASGFLVRHHWATDRHNEYGDSDYSEGLSAAAARDAMFSYIAERKRTGIPSRNFSIAPGALDDLRRVIDQATAQHARILVVYPPVYRQRFEVERADWEGYWASVLPLFPADVRIVNFNTPEFDALRDDLSSFQDSGHLSRGCSDAIVDQIARAIIAEDASARDIAR